MKKLPREKVEKVIGQGHVQNAVGEGFNRLSGRWFWVGDRTVFGPGSSIGDQNRKGVLRDLSVGANLVLGGGSLLLLDGLHRAARQRGGGSDYNL